VIVPDGTPLGQPVFVRELLAQDLKLEIERLSQDEAISVAGDLVVWTNLINIRCVTSWLTTAAPVAKLAL
jgi:hypothetical protein